MVQRSNHLSNQTRLQAPVTSVDILGMILIDSDSCRRAKATYVFSEASIRVEPLENPSELSQALRGARAILVYDSLPSISTVIDYLAAQRYWCPVIAYAERPTIDQISNAICSGADAYISWPLSPMAIQRALHRLSDAEDSAGQIKVRERIAQVQIQKLTRREQQVLALISKGASSREAAEILDISHRTVEIHRNNITKRLGVRKMAEAMQIAFASRRSEFRIALG